MCPALYVFGKPVYLFPLCAMLAGNVAVIIFFNSHRYSGCNVRLFRRCLMSGAVLALVGGKSLSALTLALQGKDFPELLWKSGFVFYGGFLGGCAGIFLFCLRNRQNFLDWMDIFCSLLPLGQAIGRFGCFFDGCCYGKPYEGIGSVLYLVDGTRIRVYPTWFMEAFGCALLFVWLWNRPGRKQRGVIFRDYLIGYGGIRFFVEYFRGDAVRGVWRGISTSQLISICLLLLGVGIAVSVRRNKAENVVW